MVNEEKQFTVKHLGLAFGAGTILGGTVVGLATALIMVLKTSTPSYPVSHLDPLPPKISPQQVAKIKQQAMGALAQQGTAELPETQGQDTTDQGKVGPFLNDNVPLVVPKETPKEKAKEVLLTELKKLPSITVGSGKNDIYVLFDPLCTHCHKMYDTFLAQGASKKYNLIAHFIPTRVFYDKQASMVASLYMNDLLLSGNTDGAQKYLAALISRNPLPLDDNWKPSEKAIYNLDRSTMALLQIGGGTPLVLFRNKNTHELETLSGEPDDNDYNDMGTI